MKNKLIGLMASVALLGGGATFAQDSGAATGATPQSSSAEGSSAGSTLDSPDAMQQDPSLQQPPATGGSGSAGASGLSGLEAQGSNELTGRVVRASSNHIYVEHMGAVVPLKVNRDTKFEDPSVKRARDLKEGDEIRASFETQKTDNIAKSISMASSQSGHGGSGSSGTLSPDPTINQDASGSGSEGTMSPDTGGSGSDSTAPSESLPPESGSSTNQPGDVTPY